MEIVKGIEIIGLGLKIKESLIITDTHIGYEEAFNKEGIFIPRFQFRELMQTLDSMIKKAAPKTIVVNGDIKHEFGKISRQEWQDTLQLIDSLAAKAKLILIKGNHDIILGPIAKKRDLKIADYYIINKTYVCHGHAIPKNKDFISAKTVIIGHEHPSIAIHDRGRVERYKCFLKGKYKNKVLLVMPSMNLVTEGVDVLAEGQLSPFINHIEKFQAYVVSDTTYYFGHLKDFTYRGG